VAQFRSFWYRGSLSPYEHLCLKSFVSKGHDFTLYSYDKIDVPNGVKLEDASSVFPEEEVFFHKRGPEAESVSPFSNWFRYKLLDEFGDWWTDTDVLCLSEEVPSNEICFAYQDELNLNGALLKVPAGHPFSRTLLREAYALGKNLDWGQYGPHLITRVVEELSLGRLALPTNIFYPLHFSHALDVLIPDLRDEVKQAVQGSCFLHLWNEILRRAPVLKNVRPPSGSYLWEQFVEHGVEFGDAAQYSEYQIQRVVESFKATLDLNGHDQEIARLGQLVKERDQEIARCGQLVKERDQEITKLTQLVNQHAQEISEMRSSMKERDQEITRLTQLVNQHAQEISEMRSSRSWRLTSPMRFVGDLAKSGRRFRARI
jgi:Alpha 1,4-glycosyltransferase conserved region